MTCRLEAASGETPADFAVLPTVEPDVPARLHLRMLNHAVSSCNVHPARVLVC